MTGTLIKNLLLVIIPFAFAALKKLVPEIPLDQTVFGDLILWAVTMLLGLFTNKELFVLGFKAQKAQRLNSYRTK